MQAPEVKLDAIQVRVLGCLVEKARTTPQNYPLSLNSLVAACNQKTSRNPLMNLDEASVESAIARLQEKRMVPFDTGTGRVPKYRQSLNRVIDLDTQELCALAVLMLRGEQTPAELRNNAQPLFQFEAPEQVERVLERLANREPALVILLPKRVGQKEARYTHLLAGPPDLEAYQAAIETKPVLHMMPHEERLTKLEAELATLKTELAALKEALGV